MPFTASTKRLTSEFVPRADIVLFVTSADRPFTESERTFLDTIRDLGKKIVVVVNKVDIFETERELDEVMTFVRGASRRLLGADTQLFGVSARRAWRAKHGDPGQWEPSGSADSRPSFARPWTMKNASG